MDTDQLDGLAEEFRFFAHSQCPGRSPIYQRLSLAVADRPALLDVASTAAVTQRRPSLLFAAIQYLLLSGVDHELSAWYPAVTGRPPAVDDPVPVFVDFCAGHREQLAALLATGRTQTNEVRRTAALVLAISHLADIAGGPVALLELGASAGLNLLLDRYRYDFDGRILGPADSPVHLAPNLHGEVPLPGRLPDLRWRLGADLAPVDVNDAEAVRWLRAFIWPEQAAELSRLDAAIDIARTDPAPLVVADAVTDLTTLLADTPTDIPTYVFHASLLTYLSRDEATELFTALRGAVADHHIRWIYLEAAGLLSAQGGPHAITATHCADRDTYVLGVVDATRDTALARVDTYGQAVRWTG